MLTSQSLPDLRGYGAAMAPAPDRRRIPQCFRSHRAMAPLVAASPALFEPRTTRIEDNVAQWYPAEQAPRWVTAWQYQKRQLLRDRDAAAIRRSLSLSHAHADLA